MGNLVKKPARSLIGVSIIFNLMTAATGAQTLRSPLLAELNSVAQRQLRERAAAIAAVGDRAHAEARQAQVRSRVLSLIGGLPDYRGPLNARVTKTTRREGFAI